MNEVMKLLTVISTIFIPDFVIWHELQYRSIAWNMPELNWYWAIHFVCRHMASSGVGYLLLARLV